ncbi:CsbD-like protein [Nocardia nova SH22a]|uniref:CsbD-like protein n=1 Tax=Nocardia nova SH22a TaxID=1415166 RepID=W5TMU2_9NOCA|nr:CsbD family protein [Nocardia nova]AHH18556.1 CsbD-like protein [Nocardia nova SH22a]
MSADDKAEEFKGRAKEAAGSLTGDDDLKAEGQADQGSSKVKQHVDEAADKIKNAADSVKDKLQGH